jgi:signal transduction histidine kinase
MMKKGWMFNGIIYLTLISVAVGGVGQFPTPLGRAIVGGLLLLLAILLAVFQPHACHSPSQNTIGMSILTLVTSCLIIISPGWSVFPILFFILAPIATTAFPIRRALLWIAIFVLITLTVFIWFRGLEGLVNALPFVTGYLFFGIFGYQMVQADEARQRSDDLLVELQQAHRQLQQYATQVEELAVVRERNHLAREVHDTLGHQLTVAVVQLEGAQRLITTDPQRAAQMVATVREQVKSGLGELRRIVATLRAAEEEDAPLLQALHSLINQFQDATSLPVKTNLPAALPTLSIPLRQTIYRATQEALTNIQKHAHASQVTLDLSQQSGWLVLEIGDNGCGIQPGGKEGFGLKGLKERAALLNGTFEIRPNAGGGTRFTFSAPLAEEVRHA